MDPIRTTKSQLILYNGIGYLSSYFNPLGSYSLRGIVADNN